MYKRIIIGLLLIFFMFSVCVAANQTAVKITFINHRSGTILGLAKFTAFDKDGSPTDYEIMEIQWSDRFKVVALLPGMYGVTQYKPGYISQNGVKVQSKITAYKSFWVKENKPAIIILF